MSGIVRHIANDVKSELKAGIDGHRDHGVRRITDAIEGMRFPSRLPACADSADAEMVSFAE
jgi:hypothetical protein